LILPDVGFDFGGGNAQEKKNNKKQKQKQKKNNKQASKNKETNKKQKQSNQNVENLWTQGPITLNCHGLIQLCKGFGWAYKRRGLYPGGRGAYKFRNEPQQC